MQLSVPFKSFYGNNINTYILIYPLLYPQYIFSLVSLVAYRLYENIFTLSLKTFNILSPIFVFCSLPFSPLPSCPYPFFPVFTLPSLFPFLLFWDQTHCRRQHTVGALCWWPITSPCVQSILLSEGSITYLITALSKNNTVSNIFLMQRFS